MSGTKKTIIVIVLVAVFVLATSPTFALFTKTGGDFSSTITTRVYDLAETSTEDVKVDIKQGDTFKFAFFAKSSEVKKLYISVTDFGSGLSYGKLSVYQNESGSLRALEKDDDGNYVDDEEFSANETRAYLIKVEAVSSAVYSSNVEIAVWSEESGPVIIIPEGGSTVDIPTTPDESGNSTTILDTTTSNITSIASGKCAKVVFKTRTDDGTNIVITADEYTDTTLSAVKCALLVTASFNETTKDLNIDSITYLDGTAFTNTPCCIVTVWTPKTAVLDKVILEVKDNAVIESLVAKEIVITPAKGQGELSLGSLACDVLTIEDGINSPVVIENLSGINGGPVSEVNLGCPNSSQIDFTSVSSIEKFNVQGGGGKNYNIVAPSVDDFSIDTGGGGSITLNVDHIGSCDLKTAGGNIVSVTAQTIDELTINSNAGCTVNAVSAKTLNIAVGGGATVNIDVSEITDELTFVSGSGGTATVNVMPKSGDTTSSGKIKELNGTFSGTFNLTAIAVDDISIKANNGSFTFTFSEVTSKLATQGTFGANDFAAEYAANSDASHSHQFNFANWMLANLRILKAS